MRKEISMEELERVNGGSFWDQVMVDAVTMWQQFKNDVSSITWRDVGDAVFNDDDEWWA